MSSTKQDLLFEVDEILERQNKILKRIENLTEAEIQALNAVKGFDVNKTTVPSVVQYEYSKEVPANTSLGDAVVERSAPFDGTITSFTIGWPDGTANAVGVKLKRKNSSSDLFPNNPQSDVVAANDYTESFDAGFSVEQNEAIQADFINNDSVHSHFVNVIIEFTEDL